MLKMLENQLTILRLYITLLGCLLHLLFQLYMAEINENRIISIAHYIGLNKQKFLRVKLYPAVITYVLCAQKNRLIETILLSTHNICSSLKYKF